MSISRLPNISPDPELIRKPIDPVFSREMIVKLLVSKRILGLLDDYHKLILNQEESIAVRISAAQGIAEIGGPTAERYLVEALESIQNSDFALLEFVCIHLAEIGGEVALQAIHDYLLPLVKKSNRFSVVLFQKELLRHKLGLRCIYDNSNFQEANTCNIEGYISSSFRLAHGPEISNCFKDLRSQTYGFETLSFDAFIIDPGERQVMLILQRLHGCNVSSANSNLLGFVAELIDDVYNLYGLILLTPTPLGIPAARLLIPSGELSHIGEVPIDNNGYKLILKPIKQPYILPISFNATFKADSGWQIQHIKQGLVAAQKTHAVILVD